MERTLGTANHHRSLGLLTKIMESWVQNSAGNGSGIRALEDDTQEISDKAFNVRVKTQYVGRRTSSREMLRGSGEGSSGGFRLNEG